MSMAKTTTTAATTTTTRHLLAAFALAVAFAAAGCVNPGGSTAAKQDTGKGTFDAGKSVPADAQRVAQSSHTKLIHRAQRPESVWVKDATTEKVVYSGPVRADSNVVVDPEANVVAVNDIQVRHEGKLDPNHTYQLYFKGR
jgi:hypothetical protein